MVNLVGYRREAAQPEIFVVSGHIRHGRRESSLKIQNTEISRRPP